MGKTTVNHSKPTGLIPPHDLDIESSVLGAILIERDAINNVLDTLTPTSFYKNAHRLLFEAVISLYNKNEPIDIVTVTTELRKSGNLELVGGSYYVADITTKVNSAANIEYHSKVIAEMALKREIIKTSADLQRLSFDETTDVFELMDKAEIELAKLSGSINVAAVSNFSDSVKEHLINMYNMETPENGVFSGLSCLDEVTNGWQPSDLIIIAARPAMGKTSLALTACMNAAINDIPTAFFSLEMSKKQLIDRILSSESGIYLSKIKKPSTIKDFEWDQINHKISNIMDAPIFIDDTPALTIQELRAKSRKLVIEKKVKLIVVDYLQLMRGSAGNREQEIAGISRGLKAIAKSFDIPVIALSQLSRAVESRGGDKRPMLSDLRESGAIEQDADIVLFTYRPEYYGITEDMDGNSTEGMGEIIIAKHRQGATKSVVAKFIGSLTKWIDL